MDPLAKEPADGRKNFALCTRKNKQPGAVEELPEIPRCPVPLTARLDSLTASSRSHPSQSLHMTERILPPEAGSFACAASKLWIAGIATSFVRRSQDPRVPTLTAGSALRRSVFPFRRCGMGGRSTEGKGRKYGQRSRPRDRPSHVGVPLLIPIYFLSAWQSGSGIGN
jgi:hypothetical protein